jgi:O-antigen/teichoic acid export membrane protein
MIHIKSKYSEKFSRLRSSFTGRAGMIFIGSVVGQGIVFLLLPATTTLYSAKILGISATTLAIVGVLSLLVTFQYDQAIIVANDSEIIPLVALCILILLGWGVLILSGLWFINNFWPGGVIIIDSLGLNYLLPLLLTYGMLNILVNVQLRQNRILVVSVSRIIYYGGTAIFQVIGGILFGGTDKIFILSQTVAALTAILILIPYSKFTRVNKYVIFDYKEFIGRVIRLAKLYIKFPKYQAPAQAVAALSIHMTTIFMRVGFSAEWAGWFFVAYRILAVPTTLVSQAIGQILYRDSAERERASIDQGKFTEIVVEGLLRVSIIIVLILEIITPIFIELFLGSEWMPVAMIIQILLISFLFAFFTSPISTLFNVKGKQLNALIFYVVLFLGRLIALIIGLHTGSELLSLVLYAVVSAVILLLISMNIMNSMGGKISNIMHGIAPLLRDVFIILIIFGMLSVLEIEDKSISLLFVFCSILLVIWRDIKRGGWDFVIEKVTSTSSGLS